MPPASSADERTSRPVGCLATRSAVTLLIPIQLSVSVAKLTRANVIATPRVSVSARWQSCITTSSGSERQLSTTSTARTAAAAAASPCPRPSITPNSAAPSAASSAIGWSPHTSSPGRGRRTAAHSIGPNLPCLNTIGNPLPHLDDGAVAGFRFDLQSVHQPARAGQAESEPASGGITVVQCTVHIRDAGTVVFGPYHQRLPAVPELHPHAHLALAGVTGYVAGDFGEGGGDHRAVGQREAEPAGELVTGLTCGDDVVGIVDVDDEVSRHCRVRSSVCGCRANGSAAQAPPRGPARCACRRMPDPAGPSRTPPRAAGRRSPCPRRAAGSCARWSATTAPRRNPSRRSR